VNSLPAFARRQQNGFAGVGIGFGLRFSLADNLSLSSQSEKTICAYRPQHLPALRRFAIHVWLTTFFRAIGSESRQFDRLWLLPWNVPPRF
jgi:hypothetical protein